MPALVAKIFSGCMRLYPTDCNSPADFSAPAAAAAVCNKSISIPASATSDSAHAFLRAAGLAGAWIGLTIQHCGNHGAMSTSPAVNKAMGLTDDLIGGSSLMWRYHHQVSVCMRMCLFSTCHHWSVADNAVCTCSVGFVYCHVCYVSW